MENFIKRMEVKKLMINIQDYKSEYEELLTKVRELGVSL